MTLNPYALADKTIKSLNRSAIRLFQKAKSAMALANFDKLTVLKQCKMLYENLKKKDIGTFYDLYVARYLEVFASVSSGKETQNTNKAQQSKADDGLMELVELYRTKKISIGGRYNSLTEKQRDALNTLYGRAKAQVNDLLSEPNPVTGYSYDNEATRKKERCEESVNAVQGKAKKQAEFDKALRFWSQMSGQYTDAVSDMANVDAMADAGVKYVRWNTQQDEKVCKTCDDRDGKIYRIDRIPDKPHWRCRCWTSPVSEKQE